MTTVSDDELRERLLDLPMDHLCGMLRAAGTSEHARAGFLDVLDLLPRQGAVAQMMSMALDEPDPVEAFHAMRDELVLRLSGDQSPIPFRLRIEALRANPEHREGA